MGTTIVVSSSAARFHITHTKFVAVSAPAIAPAVRPAA